MDHATAVAKCATGSIVTPADIRAALGWGVGSTRTRYYGLLADHSAILPVRTLDDLDRYEWAGHWEGLAVSVRRA